jgi:hypothetical protein
MTLVELEKEIIAIKKQGVTPYVERHQIARARQKYYIEKIIADKERYTTLFLNNIAFLNKIHRSKCTRYNIEDNMGIKTDDFLQTLLEGKGQIYNFEHILLVASFFGIAPDLILFVDLEANEQTIRNEYPSLFKQS